MNLIIILDWRPIYVFNYECNDCSIHLLIVRSCIYYILYVYYYTVHIWVLFDSFSLVELNLKKKTRKIFVRTVLPVKGGGCLAETSRDGKTEPELIVSNLLLGLALLLKSGYFLYLGNKYLY